MLSTKWAASSPAADRRWCRCRRYYRIRSELWWISASGGVPGPLPLYNPLQTRELTSGSPFASNKTEDEKDEKETVDSLRRPDDPRPVHRIGRRRCRGGPPILRRFLSALL